MIDGNKKGLLIVLSGPSGTGKGTLCKKILEKNDRENKIILSISATTRSPRGTEMDGVDYFFLSKEKFEAMIKNDELLEFADVFGNFYGTPKKFVQDKLNEGVDVLLEIDTQGALKIKEKFSEAILIFLLPPSFEELERRLRTRGTDSENVIERRLHDAKIEFTRLKFYDYFVVNDTIEKAVKIFESILIAEHHRV